MTDHECCFWMLSLPLDREEQCTVCVSAPLTPFQFQRFPSKIPSLSSLWLPTPPHAHQAKKISRHSHCVECVRAYGWTTELLFCHDWPARHQPRVAHVHVVHSDIVGGESAELTAADCSEWEACVRAATKGWSSRGSETLWGNKKSTLRWSRGVKTQKYHNSIDSKKGSACKKKSFL